LQPFAQTSDAPPKSGSRPKHKACRLSLQIRILVVYRTLTPKPPFAKTVALKIVASPATKGTSPRVNIALFSSNFFQGKVASRKSSLRCPHEKKVLMQHALP